MDARDRARTLVRDAIGPHYRYRLKDKKKAGVIAKCDMKLIQRLFNMDFPWT
jgi:hypothetical protein